MENRDRSKMSQNTTPTEGGDVNRNTSSNIGKEKSDSSAEFGQNIGRSENPENEPSRRTNSTSSSSGDAIGNDRGRGSQVEREH
jgi:hypothetical protein